MSEHLNKIQQTSPSSVLDRGVPEGVARVLEREVWESEDLGRKAAMVVSGIVYGGRGLKECAREAGLSVREARSLAREGWFGELVSKAVGSKLGVMSEFRCARLRERMEMIEERVEAALESGDDETLLKYLEQARKEMESGKGLESVIEALGSGQTGPMIQVNIGRYESHQPSRAATIPPMNVESDAVEFEVEDSGPQTSGETQVAQREAAQEDEETRVEIPLVGYGPEDDSLDSLLMSVTRSK